MADEAPESRQATRADLNTFFTESLLPTTPLDAWQCQLRSQQATDPRDSLSISRALLRVYQRSAWVLRVSGKESGECSRVAKPSVARVTTVCSETSPTTRCFAEDSETSEVPSMVEANNAYVMRDGRDSLRCNGPVGF